VIRARSLEVDRARGRAVRWRRDARVVVQDWWTPGDRDGARDARVTRASAGFDACG